MRLSKKIKKKVQSSLVSFYRMMSKNPNHKFIDGAYYLSIGPVLMSLRPYYGWHNAYKAAKAKDSRGFIIKGATLNAHLAQAQWKGHKQAWSAYGVRQPG